jgi:hypothetical protein
VTYWTAHRVLSSSGTEGINVFIHAHGEDFSWPDDAAKLPEANPGRLVDERTSVPPGGNRVRSYLDVLAPDGTREDEVRRALGKLSEHLASTPNPTVQRHGRVTLRFGTEAGLEERREAELLNLARAIWTDLART